VVTRSYETILTTESGDLSAVVLSVQDYLLPYFEITLEDAAADLGLTTTRGPFGPSALPEALEDMVFRSENLGGVGVLPTGELEALRDEIIFAPIVVVEQSDAAGRALGTLLSQGGAAYLADAHGSLVLVLAYEAILVLVWFASGPAIGLRNAATKAMEDASQPWLDELFRRLFENRRENARGRRDPRRRD
jgi:hypothetical protein